MLLVSKKWHHHFIFLLCFFVPFSFLVVFAIILTYLYHSSCNMSARSSESPLELAMLLEILDIFFSVHVPTFYKELSVSPVSQVCVYLSKIVILVKGTCCNQLGYVNEYPVNLLLTDFRLYTVPLRSLKIQGKVFATDRMRRERV